MNTSGTSVSTNCSSWADLFWAGPVEIFRFVEMTEKCIKRVKQALDC